MGAAEKTPREDSRKSAAEMVCEATLTLPVQLAASQELLVDNILHALNTAEPIPTRHRHKEAPTGSPSQLAKAEMVYMQKGGQLPPLVQTLQRPLQGGGEGAQVLPPGHQWQARGCISGLAEAPHWHSSGRSSGPAAQRPPPGS